MEPPVNYFSAGRDDLVGGDISVEGCSVNSKHLSDHHRRVESHTRHIVADSAGVVNRETKAKRSTQEIYFWGRIYPKS